MKALVTGAGGFIGHHLIKRLCEDGYWVRGIDIKEPYYEPSSAEEFFMFDLRKYDECQMAFVGGFDEVYHLAANMGGIGFIENNKAQIARDNVLIDMNVIDMAFKTKVKKFFFSSSACIYPANLQNTTEVISLKEEHAYPAMAEPGYGWEKLYMELVCQYYNEDYKFNTHIARFHNIYGSLGAYDNGREKAPAALCRKIALTKNGEIEVWGDGKQTRSFCYIDDCIDGIRSLMESNYHKPINIGSDRLITINEMINIIAKIAGKKITCKYDITKPKGVRGRNADLTLARIILGWQPKISLEEGLKRTYKWINQQLFLEKD